jgi:formylglycine-generating enzyme required for sulfatase activity
MLPSETEWEKAVRVTDGQRLPMGNGFDQANALAWFSSEFAISAVVDAHPAEASPYKVYEMAGNVEEWTADGYYAYPGSNYHSNAFGKKFKVLIGDSCFLSKTTDAAPTAAFPDRKILVCLGW